MIDLSILLFHFSTLQTIVVNSTVPCFMNYTAGAEMWQNCYNQSNHDFLTFALLGWQWVTGGYFDMMLVSVFVLMSYIKYQKAVYPLMIGSLFIPIAWFTFPSSWLMFAIILTGVYIGLLIAYIYISQTNEN